MALLETEIAILRGSEYAPLGGNLVLQLMKEARLNVGTWLDGWTAVPDDIADGPEFAAAALKYHSSSLEESVALAWIDWKRKQNEK